MAASLICRCSSWRSSLAGESFQLWVPGLTPAQELRSTEEKLHRTHSGMDFSEKADNGELPALLSSLPTLRLSLSLPSSPQGQIGKEEKRERGREETEVERETTERKERQERREREKRGRDTDRGAGREEEKREGERPQVPLTSPSYLWSDDASHCPVSTVRSSPGDG